MTKENEQAAPPSFAELETVALDKDTAMGKTPPVEPGLSLEGAIIGEPEVFNPFKDDIGEYDYRLVFHLSHPDYQDKYRPKGIPFAVKYKAGKVASAKSNEFALMQACWPKPGDREGKDLKMVVGQRVSVDTTVDSVGNTTYTKVSLRPFKG